MTSGGPAAAAAELPRRVGAYWLGEAIGRGGAATVHIGARASGDHALCAIKRLHEHLASDPAFVAMMLDEARIASQVRSDHVIAITDVVLEGGELFLVMPYVEGATLGALLARARRNRVSVVPGQNGASEGRPGASGVEAAIAAAIAVDVLRGLAAAHAAASPDGKPLGIVHRDVSPQNVLVGTDGVARVLDFGIAKAAGRLHHTEDGTIKGKVGYMPKEQLFGEPLDARTDVFAAGVLFWETLVGERLFAGQEEGPALVKSLFAKARPPSEVAPRIPKALDAIALRALAPEREDRFSSANEMADAIEGAIATAPRNIVSQWVRDLAGDVLGERAEKANKLSRPTFGGSRRAAPKEPARGEAPAQLRPFSRSAPRIFVLAGAVAALSVGGIWALNTRVPAVVEEAISAPSASGVGIGSSALRALDSPPPDMPVSAPSGAETGSLQTAPPGLSATAPSARSPASAPAQRPQVPSKPTSAADCSPPFTIDGEGHKRYRRHCLR